MVIYLTVMILLELSRKEKLPLVHDEGCQESWHLDPTMSHLLTEQDGSQVVRGILSFTLLLLW